MRQDNVYTFVVNEFATNCYIYRDEFSQKVIIIDPGGEEKSIINFLQKNNFIPQYVVLTHGHYDHIKSLEEILDFYPVDVVIHEDELDLILDDSKNLSLFLGQSCIRDAEKINWLKVKDNDIIFCGEQKIKVIHTPGHTKGSICLYVEDKYLFTGDTLFCGSVGRTDFPTGDISQLDESLKKIFSLPDNTIFFPGHQQHCSLKNEKLHNPFIKFVRKI
ncbi:MAG: MBL fold metallo-hydrolase [Endomicrobia bacterium]|nr:MBL fold metallo-hydrolase [Endomicrobiia bacterium]MCX7940178.1 MBL fold metallo-hydrolase [Endomicrobiia bacterium]MDW8055699.1 MBL fold metallo-hydrolase [Elusimicrobiota bacterium]